MVKVNKLIETLAENCEKCGGAGFIFFGDENNFDCETCDCVEGENYNV